MKTRNYLLLALGLWCFGSPNARADRREFLLEKGWRFTRTDDSAALRTDYDDSRWQTVTVPHDWAIYGPFNPNNDKQNVAIVQDGQVEPSEHAGRTGGLPFVGTGWYRTRFDVPEFGRDSTRRATLLFDGAMSGAQVWVNGQRVGEWPYGYNSFHFDVTPYLNADGMNNTVAVRLENLPESSRWYPGAGLYRNVHVVVTDGAHIPVWGTYVTTPVVNERFAKVNLKTEVILPETVETNRYRLVTEIRDSAGNKVAETTTRLTDYDEGVLTQDLVVDRPALWDLENPVLYTAVSKLYEGDDLKDEYSTPFGIRTIEVRPDDGFYLNGKKTVFKGVCNHHDLGPLGAAVNEAAIRRQVRMLKDMGANAIRTSHNMPAPELVRACDEMGMMLMVETFDEWRSPKCQNGYNRLFDDWAEKDLVNVIRHYRNAPSVVMWCIGNEVPEQGMEHGAKIAHWLQSIAHREDPTRPVTQGMDNPGAVINNNFAAVMEVPGFNYRPFMYPENYRKLPQRIILGTETASTLSSRGVYKFPVVRAAMKTYPDHQASSYDVEHCGWSNLPEDDFIQHEDLPYAIGEFVWTGFDYLGEPTPYYTNWPSHSSLFGIIDLAGIPKDRYYLYRSHWNPTEETLHILPHWTWPEERIGDTIPVFVYTNYPSAELFINGVSQGIRTKDTTIRVEGSYTKEAQASFERQKRYRLMWMDTKYEPGTVRVVAYDSTGRAMATEEIRTAGKPHRIELTADRTVLDATGKDLSFINVRVVDKEGNLCPEDTREIRFKVKGAGSYRAAANGNPASLELFHLPQMKLFSGQLTAIVQSAEAPGEIVFEATAPGVKGAKLTLQAK
ncbi:glycoside hydrolase family 2 TIM barrel-domain containing protein [uncultured Rikenella sp.]|uniref:glycoside hydrolase family 2 TIM barrel-domain containing protein n=1 Tax=uncultured Rikenella sp. TaxID=368003 RepID=UPI0025CD20E2|nr:glycoside hydrolase family 2 TIM barrel-domain containing protein [uncultured Rikenella sp.]